MAEICTELLKLEEGTMHCAGSEDYVITAKHTIADILRFCMTQAGDTDTSHLRAILDTMRE